MECPKCGHTNPDTAMNCEECRINLEGAREHLDKRRRIEAKKEVQKRRKTFMAGVHVFFVVVGIVSLMSVVSAISLFIRGKASILALFSPFSLFGIPLAIMALWALLSPGSAYNVFRRSSTTAPAKVLGRYTKKHDEGTDYWVTVQFNAVRPGGAVEQVTLKAQVSKRFYDRLHPGTEVTVRYATEDPCITFLQGEEVGLYSQWFERYLGLKGT